MQNGDDNTHFIKYCDPDVESYNRETKDDGDEEEPFFPEACSKDCSKRIPRMLSSIKTWSRIPPNPTLIGRLPSSNILRRQGGPTRFIKNRADHEVDVFIELFGAGAIQNIGKSPWK